MSARNLLCPTPRPSSAVGPHVKTRKTNRRRSPRVTVIAFHLVTISAFIPYSAHLPLHHRFVSTPARLYSPSRSPPRGGERARTRTRVTPFHRVIQCFVYCTTCVSDSLPVSLVFERSHSRDLELSATASLFCIRPRLSPHDDISAIRIRVSDHDPDSAALGSNRLTLPLGSTSRYTCT